VKGISHFTVGVAAASCFPGAVEAAANGNPLYFILGGVLGLLPDTIDFKFYRYFYRHHAEVTPDPLDPDPQLIADAVAGAIGQAAQSEKPFRIRLNTIRLGTDLWQRYTLRFNLPEQQVEVSMGPQVDTGNTPTGDVAENTMTATAILPARVQLDYLASTNIDIFEGPIFQMVPLKDGTVVPEFIPWHRQWSHSIIVGLMLALPAWLLWDTLAAYVVAAAYIAHVACDQLGYMGSSLFWPLTRRRTPGLKLQHSGESYPNLSAVWLSCLLVFWNLAQPVSHPLVNISTPMLILWGAIVPLGSIQLVRRWLRKSQNY
jgi:membrane-bound metal-dependent hydrolase YbcI (DUF457 family)